MNPNSVTVTWTLKIATHFLRMTLAYNDVSPYWVWLQKVQRFISSKLTLIETFNLDCDIYLEHCNPIFSLYTSLLMMIYHQIEFGCKRLASLELMKNIAEGVIF